MRFLCFLLCFLYFFSSSASSLLTCGYILEITSMNGQQLQYKIIEATKEHTQGSTPELCKKTLEQKKEIPLEQIKAGKEFLQPKVQLRAKWSSYSGMSPQGPINSSTWEFSKP